MITKIKENYIPRELSLYVFQTNERLWVKDKPIEKTSLEEVESFCKSFGPITEFGLSEWKGARLLTIKRKLLSFYLNKALANSQDVLGKKSYWESLPKWERASLLKGESKRNEE